ncbi:MAG TPA: glycosyl hydrolase-related protein, partial [Actinopolymorphaceae bacterium]|nr:glycosyl hydrolase-related protein [Actinopolymorphaceae bacterium]
EAHGGRARARLTTSFGLASAHETDLLERALGDQEHQDGGARTVDGGVDIALRPFQVLTLRLKRS